MNLDKPKIIAVLGPTSAGKTDVAVKLAKEFNGEIVSADSRQIYRYLDIATGKPTGEELLGIPYHLIDFLDPKEKFSAGEFKKIAEETIDKIIEKNKLPILEGGTGFYLDMITKGLDLPEVPPNEDLRKELEAKDNEELLEILKGLDSERLENIDKNNKPRLIRAIEIATELGHVPKIKENPKYQTLYIGIDLDDEILKEKISKRIEGWVHDGLIDEGHNLLDRGLTRDRLNDLGLEYRILGEFLDGEIDLEKMKEKMKIETFQYVKRQRTWFKKNKKINWFKPNDTEKIEEKVRDFI